MIAPAPAHQQPEMLLVPCVPDQGANQWFNIVVDTALPHHRAGIDADRQIIHEQALGVAAMQHGIAYPAEQGFDITREYEPQCH